MKGLWTRVAAFILGFSLVYVGLGISVAFVGGMIKGQMKGWLFGIAGEILLIFGLHLMHVIRIPFLEGTMGGMHKARDPRNFLEALLVGIAFAIGWSPCTGPIIGAILILAGTQDTVLAGGVLLLAYCIGLGVPFLLTAVAVEYFLKLFEKFHAHMRKVEFVSGLLLAALGILFLTQNVDLLRGLGGVSLGTIEKDLSGRIAGGLSPVAVGVSMLAGLLSFVSPCVLPLLPSYIAFIAGTSDIDELTGKDGAE